MLHNTTRQKFFGKTRTNPSPQTHRHLLPTAPEPYIHIYIVVRHHGNASRQANRVIGQPYALQDGEGIRLPSRLLITRAPVLSWFTSSFIGQPIFVIITTLSIHYSVTLSLQAQNLPFQQILPTLIHFWYTRTAFMDHWTVSDLYS